MRWLTLLGPPGVGKTLMARALPSILPPMTIDETSRSLLRAAAQQTQLSASTYHRLLKVARTIADLAGSEKM